MKRRQFIRSGAAAAAGGGFLVLGRSVHGAGEGDNEDGSYRIPRCRVTPGAVHQTVFTVAGKERLRWHYGADYPRPFFFPLLGPSGQPLTRMGHPGAPNHDHHRSVWFAHADVGGHDFWSDRSAARVRQASWLAYRGGDEEAVMAVRLLWEPGVDAPALLEQELVAALRPAGWKDSETLLELQATFRAPHGAVTLGKSNFGFLAVRVAQSLSPHFGGGVITGSEGEVGEAKLFGQPGRWVNFSGPVSATGFPARATTEGITIIDHPGNPGHPGHWHVRDDGWAGPSITRNAPLEISPERPLRLRYLIHAHRGEADAERADAVAARFAGTAPFEVAPSQRPHRQFEVGRAAQEVQE